MGEEKRRSKRMEINVDIKLNKIQNQLLPLDIREDEFAVNLVNISKDGIAFRSPERLPLNSFYDTTIELWNKEKISSISEIIRMENRGEEETLYGCRFIGINSADQFRIDVYELLNESK